MMNGLPWSSGQSGQNGAGNWSNSNSLMGGPANLTAIPPAGPTLTAASSGATGATWAAASTPAGSNISEPEDQRKALEQFDEAIAEMSLEEKAAYLEAKEKAPDVVQDETHPLKFLRYCNFNTWDAAKRMVTYWKERKEAFQERAYLPLTLNQNCLRGSALNEGDVLTLKAGYPAMLPKNKNGRTVAIFDRSQLLASTNRNNHLRAVFYMAHKGSEEEGTQTEEGSVLCFLMTIRRRLQDIDRVLNKKLFDLVDNAFPLKFQIHCLCFLPKTMRGAVATAQGTMSKSALINSVIMEQCGSRYASLMQVNLHFETKDGDIFNLMVDKGLSLEGIPKFIGGTWTFAQAGTWCEQQSFVEGGDADPQNYAWNAAHDDLQPDDDPQEVRLKRKRLNNVIHSRAKRQRKRQELEALKHECERLEKDHDTLKEEEERLHQFLLKAQELLQNVNSNDSTGAELAATANSEHISEVSSLSTISAALMMPSEPPTRPTSTEVSILTFGSDDDFASIDESAKGSTDEKVSAEERERESSSRNAHASRVNQSRSRPGGKGSLQTLVHCLQNPSEMQPTPLPDQPNEHNTVVLRNNGTLSGYAKSPQPPDWQNVPTKTCIAPPHLPAHLIQIQQASILQGQAVSGPSPTIGHYVGETSTNAPSMSRVDYLHQARMAQLLPQTNPVASSVATPQVRFGGIQPDTMLIANAALAHSQQRTSVREPNPNSQILSFLSGMVTNGNPFAEPR